MRFGKGDEILAEPQPQANLPLSRALLHYVRAAALNSLDRSSEAQQERIAFREAAAAVPSNWEMGNNSAADILPINSLVLDGEFSARAGQYDEAVAKLREGVRLEDNLKYDEPPIYISTCPACA